MSRSLPITERWQLVLDEWQRAVRTHAESRQNQVNRMSSMHTAASASALAGSAIGCVASLIALTSPGVATVISIAGCGVATLAIASQLTFFPTSRIRDASSLASRYHDLIRRIDIEKIRRPSSALDAQNRLSEISDEYAKLDENAGMVLGTQFPVPPDFSLESGVREIASSPSNTAMAGLGCGLWSYATEMSEASERAHRP